MFPVETKNCLDDEDNEDDFLNHLLKPPANLSVLEGDCLDTISESSKFESYQVRNYLLFISPSTSSKKIHL